MKDFPLPITNTPGPYLSRPGRVPRFFSSRVDGVEWGGNTPPSFLEAIKGAALLFLILFLYAIVLSLGS